MISIKFDIYFNISVQRENWKQEADKFNAASTNLTM